MRDYKYKLEYKSGDILGDFNNVFIKDVEPKVYYVKGRPRRIRRALFQCGFCGKEFENAIQLIKTNKNKSCGCYQKIALKTYYEEKK